MRSSIEQTLATIMADGMMGTGAQVVVWSGGEQAIQLAVGHDGVGRPVGEATLFRLYCAGKPLLALAMGALVDAGEVSWDDCLGDVLDSVAANNSRLASITLTQLLNHSAGLHTRTLLQLELVDDALRSDLVLSTVPPTGWDANRDAGYSTYVSWALLAMALEELSDTGWSAYIDKSILLPLGLTSSLIPWLTPTRLDAEIGRVGVNVVTAENRRIPLLLERTADFAGRPNPSYGYYGNASGLAALYAALLDARKARATALRVSPETVGTMTRSSRDSRMDHHLKRDCSFGLGFMTELSKHDFGGLCLESTFGHSGNAGACFAFADPDRDVAAAIVTNGVADLDLSLSVRRPTLVEAVYRAVD